MTETTDKRPDRSPCAFPFTESTDGPWTHHGMTLRDYFAGQVMIGIMSNPDLPFGGKKGGDLTELFEFTSLLSYQAADAMLKVREK
jgi:hypothetical protein